MTGAPRAASRTVRRETGRVVSDDGWSVGYEVAYDPSHADGRGAVLVPATKHERDGWGPTMSAELLERGFVVLSTDIRGRGDSRQPSAMYTLPPGQLRRVGDDVSAAIGRLANHELVAPGSIVLFAEQDTADAVASIAAADARIAALVLVSAKLSRRTVGSLASAGERLAVCVLSSTDDRRGLRGPVEVFASSKHPLSRIRLVSGVGSGTTMFAAWQHLRRDEPLLESWLGAWAAAVPRAGATTVVKSVH